VSLRTVTVPRYCSAMMFASEYGVLNRRVAAEIEAARESDASRIFVVEPPRDPADCETLFALDARCGVVGTRHDPDMAGCTPRLTEADGGPGITGTPSTVEESLSITHRDVDSRRFHPDADCAPCGVTAWHCATLHVFC
jgi:hypothetical protein